MRAWRSTCGALGCFSSQFAAPLPGLGFGQELALQGPQGTHGTQGCAASERLERSRAGLGQC